MKKRYLIFIGLAIISLLLVIYFNQNKNKLDTNVIKYESIKELYRDDYESNDGTMYENSSDYFDYRIYPIKIESSGDDDKILYHIIIFNKSNIDFQNARLILTLDSDMYKYIESGVIEYPMVAIDLLSINSPKKQTQEEFAHAIEGIFQPSLKHGLDSNNANKDEYFNEIARKINVRVEWDGGSESQDFELSFNLRK